MGTLNSVTLIGHLGRDPELRTAGQSVVCNLRIATTRWVKDGDDKTDWHDVVLWNRDAEIADRFLRKGSQVCVTGRLQTREWTDKTGAQRYSTEVVAHKVVLVGAESVASSRPAPARPAPAPARRETVARSNGPRPAQGSGSTGTRDAYRDDDIPF